MSHDWTWIDRAYTLKKCKRCGVYRKLDGFMFRHSLTDKLPISLDCDIELAMKVIKEVLES